MFASLILAAVTILPGIPAGDQAICPERHHPRPAPVFPEPGVSFAGSMPWSADNNVLHATKTHASDVVHVSLDGAAWFQTWVGGAGNGTYALYDTQSHAYYGCTYADTTVEFDAYEAPLGWIARAIPARPFGIRFRSAHGIGFGSSMAEVEAVYGKAKPQGFETSILQYGKVERAGGNEYGTTNTFYFEDDKLIGFSRNSGF